MSDGVTATAEVNGFMLDAVPVVTYASAIFKQGMHQT